MSRIDTAMLLAAGKGERMRPLTDHLPKPLVTVAGRALIDHALDRLKEAGLRRVVVNAWYLADQLDEHLAARRDLAVTLLREPELLDTGGGVVNALPALEAEQFLVVNADAFWFDGRSRALDRLIGAWNPERMDALLMLVRGPAAFGYDGPGDYFADPLGKLIRRVGAPSAPFVHGGVHILHRRAFDGFAPRPFSLVRTWDQAEAAERLYGIVHDGLWFHVGTPEDRQATEAYLQEHRLSPQ